MEKGIELSKDPLQNLMNYVNIALPTFEREGKLDGYPLLKSETVVVFYQVLIIIIIIMTIKKCVLYH